MAMNYLRIILQDSPTTTARTTARTTRARRTRNGSTAELVNFGPRKSKNGVTLSWTRTTGASGISTAKWNLPMIEQ